jgi:DNA polymerase IV
MLSSARVILHLDLDAFFAQAEVLAAPSLRGKPLVVGGIPGARGVVATASYEARRFGIGSGMSLAEAARRCRAAIFLPCHPARYFDLSARLLKLLLNLTPAVEVASIDEAYLDATRLVPDLAGGAKLAGSIQDEVRDTLRLSCSIGVGENKLVAKMAAGLRKPGGLVCLDREAFRARFHPEPVSVLYGIGPATAPKLERIGIHTIADLARTPDHALRDLFGIWGPLLGAAARGDDESPVVPYHARPEAKSLGHEYTLPRDQVDRVEIFRLLLGLCDEVAGDLRAEGWRAGSIHIKVRWSDWKSIGRQRTLDSPTDSARRLFNAGRRLFEQNDSGKAVRLIGVSAADLSPAKRAADPGNLFGDPDGRELDAAIDKLRDAFGRGAIKRASMISGRSRHRAE